MTVTVKELRKIARETLAKYLKGEKISQDRAHHAIQVLHAPEQKGE